MAVKVTKPEINLREKLTEINKPSGIAGEAILRAETPQEVFNYIGAGRRNLIINGAMQVAQRGTSFSHNGAVQQFPVDRNRVEIYAGGFATPTGGTSAQVSLSDADSELIGFDKALRITSASDSKLCYVYQKIEGKVKETATKQITVSFYARIDSGTFTLQSQGRTSQSFGSGGSSDVNVYADYEDAVITTRWKRMQYTLTLPSVTAKTFGTAPHVFVRAIQSEDLSAVGWLEITGFQVEVGKVATPFEHRSYGEELALCQRYFQVFPPRNGGMLYWTVSYLGGTVRAIVLVPSPMRALPTPTDPNTGTSTCNTGNVYSSTGTNVSSQTNEGNAPILSVTGTSEAPVLIMGWTGASTPTGISNNYDSASWNGGSPGIFLNAEL